MDSSSASQVVPATTGSEATPLATEITFQQPYTAQWIAKAGGEVRRNSSCKTCSKKHIKVNNSVEKAFRTI